MHMKFQYEMYSLMEQIEACEMDKSITPIMKDLMLRGLFTYAESMFGDSVIVALRLDGGPRVFNPFRKNIDIDDHLNLRLKPDDEDYPDEDDDEDDPYDSPYGVIGGGM